MQKIKMEEMEITISGFGFSMNDLNRYSQNFLFQEIISLKFLQKLLNQQQSQEEAFSAQLSEELT